MLKYFYGTMGSSKTAQALITEYNYRENGYATILLKPAIHTREATIKSRIGLSRECIKFSEGDNLLKLELFPAETKDSEKIVVIVDEVQFCTAAQIEQLRKMANKITVLCYGLKTNYKTYLFEGSKRLLELADEIQEIPSLCTCGRKATLTAFFENSQLLTTGPDIIITPITYKSLCPVCYSKSFKDFVIHNN